MEYALITAFLILVIVLSVLAYVGHRYVKNDIKGKRLEEENAKLKEKIIWLTADLDQMKLERQTPTLQQALQQTSYGDWTKHYPTNIGFGTVPSFTAPYFVGTQYEEH